MSEVDLHSCSICGVQFDGSESATGHLRNDRPHIHHDNCGIACPDCEGREDPIVIDLTADG